jgi:hypothetical protein
MTRNVRPEEYRAVIALPASRRYEYCIKRVVDAEAVWALRSAEGWVMAADDNGTETFPIWPDATYADACSDGEWAGAEAVAIPLDEWKDKWLTGLGRDGRRVAVFPVAGGRAGVGVDPSRLLGDLQAEEERY